MTIVWKPQKIDNSCFLSDSASGCPEGSTIVTGWAGKAIQVASSSVRDVTDNVLPAHTHTTKTLGAGDLNTGYGYYYPGNAACSTETPTLQQPKVELILCKAYDL